MTSIPVFISSTFRDLQQERDELKQQVEPELNRRLAPYGCRVELIDLRWGVTTADVSEDTRQAQVLDVCLREIQRSDPLFVGLVGDRYGWIPPVGHAKAAADEAGLTALPDDTSVTAMEFHHGLFDRGDARSVVFVRDLTGPVPPAWCETSADGPTRLEQLKARLDATAARPDRALNVHRYTAATDGRRVLDLRTAFTPAAIEQIWHLVEPIAAGRRRARGSASAEQLAAHLFFEAHHSTVGRDQLTDHVVTRLTRGASVILHGPSGIGKSSIWCRVVEALEKDPTHRMATLVVGSEAGTTSTSDAIRLLAPQLGLTMPTRKVLDEHAEPQRGASDAELASWWRSNLAYVGPSIIAVDGTDSFDAGRAFDALPALVGLPPNCRLLATTTEDAHSDLLATFGVEPLPVTRLAADVVPEVVRVLSGGRNIPQSVVAALAYQDRDPLWISFALGRLSQLSYEDFAPVASADDPAVALDRLLHRSITELPDSTQDVARDMIDRSISHFGSDTVSRLLIPLAASRSGLTRADIRSISNMSELTIARVLRNLDALLTERGPGGRIRFVHGIAGQAIVRRFGACGPEVHDTIAAHLTTSHRVDESSETESQTHRDDLLWHRLNGRSDPDASAFLNALPSNSLQAERTTHIIIDAIDSGADITRRLTQLTETGLTHLIHIGYTVNDVRPPVVGIRLQRQIVAIADAFAERQGHTTAVISRVSAARKELAYALLRGGDLQESHETAIAAVDGFRAVGKRRDRERFHDKFKLASALATLAQVCEARGQISDARRHLSESLSIHSVLHTHNSNPRPLSPKWSAVQTSAYLQTLAEQRSIEESIGNHKAATKLARMHDRLESEFDLAPHTADATRLLAAAERHDDLGEFEDARTKVELALDALRAEQLKDPSDHSRLARRAETYAFAAMGSLRAGDSDRAATEADHAVTDAERVTVLMPHALQAYKAIAATFTAAAKVHMARGETAAAAKRFSRAFELLDRCPEPDQDLRLAQYKLGRVRIAHLQSTGRPDEALATAENFAAETAAAVTEQPSHSLLRLSHAQFVALAGLFTYEYASVGAGEADDLEAARSRLCTVVELLEQHHYPGQYRNEIDVLLMWVVTTLSLVYIRTGRTEQAAEVLEDRLASFPRLVPSFPTVEHTRTNLDAIVTFAKELTIADSGDWQRLIDVARTARHAVP